ncbi:MAG: hypothetical protein WEB63_03945 [Cucumibacter sp.]
MRFLTFAAAIVGALAEPAFAYIGPGLGLGTIGVIVGLLASIVLALVALIWYPVKRLIGRSKSPAPSKASRTEEPL